MDHLSAAGSSATRNLTTTEPSESLNRRKTVDFRFQRPHATSGSFFFNKPMRAMDSRRDFTSKKVFSGYFSELGEKANSALISATDPNQGTSLPGRPPTPPRLLGGAGRALGSTLLHTAAPAAQGARRARRSRAPPAWATTTRPCV